MATAKRTLGWQEDGSYLEAYYSPEYPRGWSVLQEQMETEGFRIVSYDSSEAPRADITWDWWDGNKYVRWTPVTEGARLWLMVNG